MKKIKTKKEREFEKRVEFKLKNTFKCKCGHSVVIYPNTKKVICSWCRKYVYRDKKEEFKDKLKEELRKV